jgi:hypothetical protein
MSAPLPRRLLARLAVVVVTGATALSVAACGSSDNHNGAQPDTSASQLSPAPKPPPPPPPPPPVGKDHIEGLVRSVSGNTINLTQRDRSAATVDFAPATMVTELSSAALPDVKPGACVNVKPAAPSASPDAAMTAESVEISPAVASRCPPPPTPGAGPAAGVSGAVASVTDNTIAVNSIDPTGKPTHSTVNVTSTTTYTKHAVTNSQAIQQGKCMAAQGTINAGVLQATTIDLEPCPPMGGGRRRFHVPALPALPHLPHFRHR